MSSYITLANYGGTLQKKFRVLSTGYSPVREKVGVIRTTVTGKVDNQCGPILGKWQYTLRVYETDPTDPTKSDGDTEGYGTLEHLKMLFDYHTPPDNKLLFTDFGTSVYNTANSLPTVGSQDSSVGLEAWGDEDEITSESDDDWAGCALPSYFQSWYLVGSGFGFSIPSGSTIYGVVAQIRRCAHSSMAVVDEIVKLYYDGGVIGDDHRSTEVWPSAGFETLEYGQAADKWGCLLTPEIVNSSSFGIALSIFNTGAGEVCKVSWMKLAVYYGTGTLCNVYLPGTLSEKNLTPYIIGGCACFDVPVTIVAAEALA